MAVITLTDREKESLANQYDENKRTFERVLARDLRAFFAGIGTDIFASFVATGLPPNFNSYIEELAAILRTNYRKVGAFFSSHIQRLLRELQPATAEQEQQAEVVREERLGIEALLLLSLNRFYRIQSRQQAQFILNTTSKITNDVRIQTLAQATINGETLNNDELAREIAKEVNRRNRKRAPNIAEDQVGDIAQKAKQSEADELVRATSLSGLGLEPRKTWITVGDDRVRDRHRRANSQERPLNQLYLVGGERLMYPKDMSHGASLGNTINCRCDSVTEI